MKKKPTKREKIKSSARRFESEFKKSVSTALIAAFGFIIALAWRDYITEALNSLVKVSPLQGKLFSALIITFFSVVGILVVTRFLSVKE